MNKKAKIMLACLLILGCFAAIGCVQEEEATSADAAEGMTEQTISEEKVIIGIPSWDDGRATANVLKHVLESEGHESEIIVADLGGIYQAVAQDDIDVFPSAWLPATQAPYWDKYGEDIVYVNNVSSGAKCGLVVPEYVEIDSIEELQENRDKFDGVIRGIEPGAGIMQNCEVAIEEYNLDYELHSSSTVGMSTVLQEAIDNEEWVVVTLWEPHWTFARMDLKFLEDPKGIFGESDNIVMLTRNGFQEDNPEVYEIISRFEMDTGEIAAIMIDLDAGMDPEDAASKWIENNPERVNDFLGN
ncbi:glycine betaine ABC transporter substrate-binding protein [Methanolobus halotolerans]|nr:glycine betaine ABC transporter substrate-binding protein [Methanolobus halotolerans]